ncbi:MAG: HD domain-containing protein [Pseudomonadota bacterium]
MIRKALLLRFLDAANMQRWNDKIRPVELTELDKQAHKMIIAYLLGKFEEGNSTFDWVEIIEGGLFELLQRLVVTDIKPQIFHKIKQDEASYRELNQWVFKELESIISPLGEEFCKKFRDYFLSDRTDNINKRVLNAAHFYATKWEFNIIEHANPGGYEIDEIKKNLQMEQEKNYDLTGMVQLVMYNTLRNFVDLCGQLRFQIRWGHVYRTPKTSVLGHMLVVAILSYLFTLEIRGCKKRCLNNYFTGLFHDLPEVLTRDIISPVKRSVKGLSRLIKQYETDQMKVVYSMVPQEWHDEIKMFTADEFTSIATVNGKTEKVKSIDISNRFNKNEFNPRDGELVKVADDLAAFIEAYSAIKNGISSPDLNAASSSLKEKYRKQQSHVGGLNIGEIYADFD